jgi:hypothetical protein
VLPHPTSELGGCEEVGRDGHRNIAESSSSHSERRRREKRGNGRGHDEDGREFNGRDVGVR